MKSSIQIGFNEYLDENLSDLCDEYYGRPQPDPSELYAWDLGFRNYCHEIWEDAVDAYDTAREHSYN